MASLVGFGGFDTLNVKDEKERLKVIKSIKGTFCVAIEETQAHNMYAPTRGQVIKGEKQMTKSQIKKALNEAYSMGNLGKLWEALGNTLEQVEDLINECEDTISEIEPYENREDLTPQQEERQEWFEELQSDLEEMRDNLETFQGDLADFQERLEERE